MDSNVSGQVSLAIPGLHLEDYIEEVLHSMGREQGGESKHQRQLAQQA